VGGQPSGPKSVFIRRPFSFPSPALAVSETLALALPQRVPTFNFFQAVPASVSVGIVKISFVQLVPSKACWTSFFPFNFSFFWLWVAGHPCK